MNNSFVSWSKIPEKWIRITARATMILELYIEQMQKNSSEQRICRKSFWQSSELWRLSFFGPEHSLKLWQSASIKYKFLPRKWGKICQYSQCKTNDKNILAKAVSQVAIYFGDFQTENFQFCARKSFKKPFKVPRPSFSTSYSFLKKKKWFAFVLLFDKI